MHGKRVIVMGLGRHGGGVAAARWLAEQGCRVTVTDLESEDQLADSVAQLRDVPIERFVLGRHDEADFRKADLVVVNPAVRMRNQLVHLARERGAEITSEIELFLERCPAKVVGVTGTAGKSTTCTMLAEILRAAGRCTWLGGNIGVSLLSELQFMHEADVVVLELSSFQLAHLSRAAKLPRIAVVTNCSPNHLDWHGSWRDYVWAKQRLLAADSSEQVVVLNTCDHDVSTWMELVDGGPLLLIDENHIPDLQIAGAHNRENARLAATVATYLGVDLPTIRQTLQGFQGLAHRQQFVAEFSGRRFINDSKATSLAATIAALDAAAGPVWLLAGGVEKDVDWSGLAARIVSKAKGAAFFGQARHSLQAAVRAADPRFLQVAAEVLSDAVAWAFEKSRPGDTILLSPACPSFDQFADFAERGRLFAELAQALAESEIRGSNVTT